MAAFWLGDQFKYFSQTGLLLCKITHFNLFISHLLLISLQKPQNDLFRHADDSVFDTLQDYFSKLRSWTEEENVHVFGSHTHHRMTSFLQLLLVCDATTLLHLAAWYSYCTSTHTACLSQDPAVCHMYVYVKNNLLQLQWRVRLVTHAGQTPV